MTKNGIEIKVNTVAAIATGPDQSITAIFCQSSGSRLAKYSLHRVEKTMIPMT